MHGRALVIGKTSKSAVLLRFYIKEHNAGSYDAVGSTAPYLEGVLGVPEHPRNLGVHKMGKT